MAEDDETYTWLRDQHPRGLQILAQRASEDKGEEVTTQQMAKDLEVPPYEQWSYRDLQDECRERELSAKGTKEELVQALNQYDADHPTETDE